MLIIQNKHVVVSHVTAKKGGKRIPFTLLSPFWGEGKKNDLIRTKRDNNIPYHDNSLSDDV